MPDNKKDRGRSGSRMRRDLLWISTLGINLVLSSAAGVVLGFFLDKWLNTRPVLTLVFFCIGTFAGFRQIYKEIQKLGNDDTHEQQ